MKFDSKKSEYLLWPILLATFSLLLLNMVKQERSVKLLKATDDELRQDLARKQDRVGYEKNAKALFPTVMWETGQEPAENEWLKPDAIKLPDGNLLKYGIESDGEVRFFYLKDKTGSIQKIGKLPKELSYMPGVSDLDGSPWLDGIQEISQWGVTMNVYSAAKPLGFGEWREPISRVSLSGLQVFE